MSGGRMRAAGHDSAAYIGDGQALAARVGTDRHEPDCPCRTCRRVRRRDMARRGRKLDTAARQTEG